MRTRATPHDFAMLFMAMALTAIPLCANEAGDTVVMLRDVFVSLSGITNCPPVQAGAGAPPETRAAALLAEQRFPLVSETPGHVVLRATSGGATRDITVPRQDVRIDRAPPPPPLSDKKLRALWTHMEHAETRRNKAHSAIEEGLRELRPLADAVRRKQRLDIAGAALAAELAGAVTDYQSLAAGLPAASRATDIVRDELGALLASHQALAADIQALSQDVATLEQTLPPLTKIKTDLDHLDALLQGRDETIAVLVEGGATPVVMEKLGRAEQNIHTIADAYKRIPSAVGDIPRQSRLVRRMNEEMDELEVRQQALQQAGANIQVRLSLLKELTP